MFCSNNTSPFGYIAILGTTKISIYLAYGEDVQSSYDLVWQITAWDLRKNKIGRTVDIVAFTKECEDFVTYQRTGEITLWSMKNKRFKTKVCKLGKNDTPLSQLKCVKEDQIMIGYS